MPLLLYNVHLRPVPLLPAPSWGWRLWAGLAPVGVGSLSLKRVHGNRNMHFVAHLLHVFSLLK